MREECIVCGNDLMPIYTCKDMPASAQILPVKEELKYDAPINVDLCQCSGCGLVQFNCEPVSYYKDSTRAGERSKVLIDLRHQQYKHFIEMFHLQGKKLLEVGAGKGGFLKTLQEMTEYDVDGYGIENNAEFVKFANNEYGVKMQQGFLDDANKKILYAPFDAFTSFAYPARLTDPNTMLRCVYNNLTDDGVGFVMVPSWEHLCKPGGFYDIVVDHIAYYSSETLELLLSKNGFDVKEIGEAADTYNYAIVQKKKKIDLHDIWTDVESVAKSVRDFVADNTCDGKKIAVWCAGHYAFTVLSVSGISSQVSYIIDNAMFKQGHFAPGSHVPIVSPEHFAEEPVNTILILGPMYVEELVKEIHEKCSHEVSVAVMNRDGIKLLR